MLRDSWKEDAVTWNVNTLWMCGWLNSEWNANDNNNMRHWITKSVSLRMKNKSTIVVCVCYSHEYRYHVKSLIRPSLRHDFIAKTAFHRNTNLSWFYGMHIDWNIVEKKEKKRNNQIFHSSWCIDLMHKWWIIFHGK